MPKSLPEGLVTVTKNKFFTYIGPKEGGAAHRWAVQVWNTQSGGWNFEIHTGGTFKVGSKIETNTFHKKHLVTLSTGKTLDDKSANIAGKRSTNFSETTTARNKKSNSIMQAIKKEMPITTDTKQQTSEARSAAAKHYFPKGYGNKLNNVDTLTFIDCSMFTSSVDLASKFADALAPGANKLTLKHEEFISGGTWHPTVDFGKDCVYEFKNGLLGTPKQKAKIQVYLHKVDHAAKKIKCHVCHLAEAC